MLRAASLEEIIALYFVPRESVAANSLLSDDSKRWTQVSTREFAILASCHDGVVGFAGTVAVTATGTNRAATGVLIAMAGARIVRRVG